MVSLALVDVDETLNLEVRRLTTPSFHAGTLKACDTAVKVVRVRVGSMTTQDEWSCLRHRLDVDIEGNNVVDHLFNDM